MRGLTAALARSRSQYGAHPLHLLALLATFALSGYAFFRASMGPLPIRMLVWFLVAVVGHDLVLYPLYALADRSWHLLAGRRRVRRSPARQEPSVPAANHLRVPVVLSGFLLIAFWGTISGQGDRAFFAASDHHFAPYLTRWLAITGAFFAVSAVLYAWRLGSARRRKPGATAAAADDPQRQDTP